MKIRKYLRALLCLASVFLSKESNAFLGDIYFLPPHANYQRIETSHFFLIYPNSLESEANLSAKFLEQAHDKLKTVYQYEPDHKTTVILADNQDFANGVTSAVGHQGIVLLMTAPDPYSSIGEYEHWLSNLIIHEYTHYLTLAQRRGIFSFARFLFGDLIYPNHGWPTWLAEGFAVHSESSYTLSGRGYGTYYQTLARDGIYRGILGTKSFLDFNQLSGPIPKYPFGEAAYFSGYAMVDEMLEEYGANSLARFPEESSWRVPYFLNGTLENVTQTLGNNTKSPSFHDLWDHWIARQAAHLKPEFDWLKEQNTVDPQFLTSESVSAIGARLSPDGQKLAYFLSSGHERPALYLIEDLNHPKPRHLDDAVSGAAVSWSEDGKKLFYAKHDFSGPLALLSEIYSYDLESGRVSQITFEERAKDPDFCGDAIVYSTHRGKTSELRSVDLKTGEIKILYRAADYHHAATPRCSPDYSTVFFSEHGIDPYDAIYALDRRKKISRPIVGGVTKKQRALFPEPITSKSFYFTLAKDGYYELARWDETKGSIVRVARASGGYWMPSLSRNSRKTDAQPTQMALSYVSSLGIRAALVDPTELEKKLASGIKKTPTAVIEKSKDALPNIPSSQEVVLKCSRYNVFNSLTPRIWAPYVSFDNNQSQYGLNILGWDDLDQLEYNFFAWYDSISKNPEGIFSTFHRISTFKLGFSASSQVSAYATNSSGLRIFDEERKFSTSLQRPLPGIFSEFTPAFIAEWARTYRAGDFGKRTFNPETRLGINLTYESLQKFSYSITEEKGSLAQFRGRRFFSGNFHAWKTLINWEQLFSIYPQHSVLSLQAFLAIAPLPVAEIPESFVRIGGKGTLGDLDPPLRGYPLGNFGARRAGIIQAEYRLPVAQFFHGFETFPLFMRNLGIFAFYDGAKIQSIAEERYSRLISSTGGGILLNTAIGYAYPLQIRFEYAHGLQTDLNGQDVFMVGASF